MNLLSLFFYAAIGAVLAWKCLALLQRTRPGRLRCITPYVPARERNALPAPKP